MGADSGYPRPEPPDDLLPGWPVLECDAESPAWGWEGEGEQCMRRAHSDPWHYTSPDGHVRIWWSRQ